MDVRQWDVLKITHVQYNGDRGDGCFPDEYLPAWAVALKDVGVQRGSNVVEIYLLSDYPDVARSSYNPPRMKLSDDCDDFHVVRGDAIPDEILVKLTQLQLAGEV